MEQALCLQTDKFIISKLLSMLDDVAEKCYFSKTDYTVKFLDSRTEVDKKN